MRLDGTSNDRDHERPRPTALGVASWCCGSRAVVALDGELDMEGTGIVADEVRRHLAQGVESVEIDGAALDFVDSAGLHLLLLMQSEVHAAGVEFGVMASPQLTRLLALTGLTGVLTVVA